MNNKAPLSIAQTQTGKFLLTGDLTYASIDNNILKALNIKPDMPDITLDLKQVSTTDSAGLALLLEWIKIARVAKISIHLQNIPEQLIGIAKLSGLESVMQVTADNTPPLSPK